MKRLPILLLGISIGMIISMSTSALASSIKETIVQYASFTFIVDGEERVLQVDPILTPENKTYLPVRELSNMLGYDVTYKSDIKTIEMNYNDTRRIAEETGSNIPIEENLGNGEYVLSYDFWMFALSSGIDYIIDTKLLYQGKSYSTKRPNIIYHNGDPYLQVNFIREVFGDIDISDLKVHYFREGSLTAN